MSFRLPTRKELIATIIGLIIYAAILVFSVFFSNIELYKTPSESIHLTEGERYLGYSDRPPSDEDPAWTTVQLPDDWRNKDMPFTDAWYRFRVPKADANETVLAVYIPTVRQNMALFINDRWVGEGGPFDSGYTRVWHQPQMYQFSSLLLSEPENVVHLRLSTHRESSGYLSEIFIAASESIFENWQWRNWLKVDLLRFIAHFFIIVGILNLTMWALRLHETYYLWYALAALVWGIRCYLLLPTGPQINHDLWASLRLITLGWGTVFVLLFNLRFFAQQNKKVDALLFLYCVPLAVPMLFMSAETLHGYGHQFWARMCIVIATYTSYKLVSIYARSGDIRSIMLLCTGIPLFVFGFYDLLVLNDHLSPKNGFIINYASPPALILAMWFMFQRFSRSLDEAEELNVTLDKRVKNKQHELQQQYLHQEELQRKQVLTEERERIMRDMHDGLGGHLVGLKSLTDERNEESPNINRIRDHIDHALLDLRFVINSLDQNFKSLPMLLGSMRKRWQQLSESNGFLLNWKIEDPREDLVLRPSKALQTMRILEEAFTNAVKHSGASQISVCYFEHKGQHIVKIVDNGSRPWRSSEGRGVANMHYRAQQIGVELKIDKNKKGCEVIVNFPPSQ